LETDSKFGSQPPEAHGPEISTRKLEANRKNALKSTGPKNPEGKRFSSRNALKHGLLSRELVIEDGEGTENVSEFKKLFLELIEDFQPQGRAELSLVETVAICDWRFRRTLRAEAEGIALGARRRVNSTPAFQQMSVLPPSNMTNLILRYQTTIYRQKMQALQLLEKLQQSRRKAEPMSGDARPDAGEK